MGTMSYTRNDGWYVPTCLFFFLLKETFTGLIQLFRSWVKSHSLPSVLHQPIGQHSKANCFPLASTWTFLLQ